MTRQTALKQERIIEAVRHGLEGDAAVDFIRESGYAMTTAGIARHLRSMGGKARILELIEEGKTNLEIMELTLPDDDLDELHRTPPSQGELFNEPFPGEDAGPLDAPESPLYETTKVSVRLPSDLYEAIRIAAKAEGKSQNQLIVDALTSALSEMPRRPE